MLLGTHPNFRGNSTPFEYATSHAMQDAWVAFAKDVTQGLDSTGWSEYECIREATEREFGDEVSEKDVGLAGL